MIQRDWRQTYANRVAPLLATSGLKGTIKVVVEGEPAPWYVALDGKTAPSSTAVPKIDGIVRGAPADLEALLDGRMSLADGILTERIGVSGDVQLVMGLGQLLAKAGA